MVALNSAAHGSETADALLAALPIKDGPGIDCNDLPEFTREACREVERTLPIQDFIAAGVEALGADGVPDGGVRDFLRARIAGLRSLGTAESARFWREHGAELPKTTLYLSFRSFIGDTERDLPASNAWSYLILVAVDPSATENDMQVRLVNHALGGPLADVEVVGPAAEGNHWQWPLTANDLSPLLQPPTMSERMPHEALLVAYYQTLHEAGLLLP
jgi:hypothetical protein